jgi:hypothetical protein
LEYLLDLRSSFSLAVIFDVFEEVMDLGITTETDSTLYKLVLEAILDRINGLQEVLLQVARKVNALM